MTPHTCIGRSLCLSPTFCEACARERAQAEARAHDAVCTYVPVWWFPVTREDQFGTWTVTAVNRDALALRVAGELPTSIKPTGFDGLPATTETMS